MRLAVFAHVLFLLAIILDYKERRNLRKAIAAMTLRYKASQTLYLRRNNRSRTQILHHTLPLLSSHSIFSDVFGCNNSFSLITLKIHNEYDARCRSSIPSLVFNGIVEHET